METIRIEARNNLLKAVASVVQALKRRDRKEPGWKEKEQAEERLAEVFQPIFDRMARLIRKRLQELDGTRPKEPKSIQLKLVPTQIFEGLDITDDEADKIRGELFNTVYNGSGLFQEQTGYILDIGLINKEARDWASVYSGELITKITETTREIVRETISDFVATPGMTIADAMGRMPFDPQRAQMIAVTEVTRSYAQGNQIAGEVMKEQFPDVPVIKVWFTNNDDLVCEICGPLNGTEVGLNDSWDSDDGPVDNPPAHVNCRCWTQTTTNILAGEHPAPAPEPPPAPAPAPIASPAPAPEPKPIAAPKKPKQPKWMPGDPVPVFKTPEEAEKWFTKNKITKYAKFGKLDQRVIQEIADSFGRNISEFPKLQGRMKFAGSAQARIELQKELIEAEMRDSLLRFHPELTEAEIRDKIKLQLRQYKLAVDDHAYAISYSGYQYADLTGVVVNETYGANYSKFITSLEKDVRLLWHPVGCGNVKAVMDHELGHQIDSLLRLTNRTTAQSFADAELKRIYNEAKKMGIEDALSGYGKTKKSEFLAEAWSEYLNNPNPRRAAQEFGDRIRQIYTEKYP